MFLIIHHYFMLRLESPDERAMLQYNYNYLFSSLRTPPLRLRGCMMI